MAKASPLQYRIDNSFTAATRVKSLERALRLSFLFFWCRPRPILTDANGNVNSFRERHMNKHPSAMLLDYQSIPDEDLQNSDGQYIQICQVTPEPDRSFPIFQNPDVPTAVRAYYEHNGTNVFSFETKFSKASADQARNTSVSTDFLSTWSLRTSLMCADAFPTVLKRTEVVETRYLEISPVEKALKDVEKNATELQSLVRKYSTLKEVRRCPSIQFLSCRWIVCHMLISDCVHS